MLRVITSYIVLPTQDPSVALPAVRSLPLLKGKKLPHGRFIGSFGIHSTLEMLASARQALSTNQALRRVEISVESTSTRITHISREMLPECDAIHLNLLSPDLREIVCGILGAIPPSKITQSIAQDMTRLNTLWDDPLFTHCKLFLWNAPRPSNPQFQLGAIARPDCVSLVRVFNHSSARETNVDFVSAE